MRIFLKGTITLGAALISLPLYGQIEEAEIIKYTPAPVYTPFFIPTLTHVYFTTSTQSSTTSTKPSPTPSQNIPVVTPVITKTPSTFPPPMFNLPIVTPIPQTKRDEVEIISTPVRKVPTPKPTFTPFYSDIASPTPTLTSTPVPAPSPTPKPTPTPTPKSTNTEIGKFEDLWKKDYIQAYKNARKDDKLIIVFIGFETCYQCKELKKDIQSLFTGHYERIYIDREKNDQYKKFFSSYKLAPTLLIIDSSNSKIIRKIVGYQHSDFQKLSSFVNQ